MFNLACLKNKCFVTAGDYVKFGFPLASAMTMMAWGMIDFKQGYVKAGQWEYAKGALKWGMDFMIKVWSYYFIA